MQINLTLSVNSSSAKNFYDSLIVDFKDLGRSKVEMNLNRDELIFNISSNDFTALRASINSIILKLRMLKELEV